MLNTCIIIPARYQSSRFPGKPLAKIVGISLIERVWNISIKSNADYVAVATDDERIADHCKRKNINFIMTSSKCKTGTDRIYNASKKIKSKYYFNVQGDEPLIKYTDINKIIKFTLKGNEVTCGMAKIKEKSEYFSLSVPKVVTNKNGYLQYISRSPIPGSKTKEYINSYKQVCIYGLPKKYLDFFGKFKVKTSLEEYEDIEMIRFLENSVKVKMIKVSDSSIAVDFKKDIAKVERAILNS